MFDDLKQRLAGCFYTIFTPYDEAEAVDFDALERYLSFLFNRGAKKFYAMAYNSRYSQMSSSEIYEFNEFCIKTVKGFDSSNIVVVGDPIHCSTVESAEFARHARDRGADLISLIIREKYFSDDQILEHFDLVARDSKMAILVHEMPFLSGYDGTQIHWPESLFTKFLKNPFIVALKEDAKDFSVTCAALRLEPQIRVLIAGRKSAFVQYKPYGASAYLNGISIIDPQIGERFWSAYKNNDDETIQFILTKLEAPFFDGVVSRFGWHRTNKALLQAAGLMHRRDRMPLKHLSDVDFSDVQEVYKQIQAAWAPVSGEQA